MYAMAKERISAPFEELFYTRLIMNDVVRFLLNHPPERNYFLVLLNDPGFQSLVEINENARKLADEIKRFRSSESYLQEAVLEYNALFVGPNPLPAPLWESVYLGREHILFDEQTLNARKFYRKYGLNFIFENNQPDDHIAVELEFLAYMIRSSLESESVSDVKKLVSDQVCFLNCHLGNWVPSFCGRLLQGTEHPLYQSLASLLQDYLEFELETAEFIEEWLI